MKKEICSFALCSLLIFALFGCAAPGEVGEEPATDEEGISARLDQLEREVAFLRLDQAMLNSDYEKRLADLESSALPSGGTLPVVSGTPTDPVVKEPERDPASFYRVSEENGEVTLLAYIGNETEVSVPSMIGGKPVVSIGEGAFRNSAVESVVIPEGVRTLDWFAFYGCYRLDEVELPASLERIEYGAFSLCSSSLCFAGTPGSYAEAYAASYGIPWKSR